MSRNLILLLFPLLLLAQNAQIHHEINASIEPSESFIEVVDIITIPEAQ